MTTTNSPRAPRTPLLALALALVATLVLVATCGLSTATPVHGIWVTPVINTTYGPVRGYTYDDAYSIFRGIPFASPPVNELRMASPVPPTSWTDVLDAFLPPSLCPQVRLDDVYLGSEDCLYLNVYVPNVDMVGSLPVFLWIYGGGYTFGDGYEFGLYEGDRLATSQNMIVVTINYRLSALGFLALDELQQSDSRNSTGNYALLDQALAFQWVADNIAQFGGDPSRITIAGESAGAFSVCWHLVSPLTPRVFRSAIMESGTCDSSAFFVARNNSVSWGETFSASVGCTESGPARVKCLRAASVDSLLQNDLSADVQEWASVSSSHVFRSRLDEGASIEASASSSDAFPVPIFDLRGHLDNTIDTVRRLYAGEIELTYPIFRASARTKLHAHHRRVKFAGDVATTPYTPVLSPAFDWGPTIDGVALTDLPLSSIRRGDWAQVPIVLGTNHDEGSIFLRELPRIIPSVHTPLEESDIGPVLLHFWPNNLTIPSLILNEYPIASFPTIDALISRVLRDYQFACPARRTARAVSSQSLGVWLYQYDYPGDWIEDPYLGVYHSAELEFVFDNPWPPLIHSFSANDTKIASYFGSYWGGFVRGADPNKALNGTSTPLDWPAYTPNNEQSISIALPLQIVTGLLDEQCALWDDIFANNV